MNKQEFINKLKELLTKSTNKYDRGHDYGIRRAISLAEDLDDPMRPPEPTPLEPEKPVVPQYVADWYEEHKDNFEYSVQCLCVHGCEPVRKIDTWFDSDDNKPIETLVKMKLFGYEIEKEKLYTVELPNPNGGEYGRVFLGKYSSGKVGLHCWTSYKQINFDDSWKKDKIAQLTEEEIKQDFDWAWKWAKPVDGGING